MQECMYISVSVCWCSGGSRRGANPAMAPHRNWQWSLAPFRDRKSNGSIVILLKSKDFGPPSVSMSAADLAPLEKYRDVNKDLTPKDQDKDKDLTPKDQDKDKDLTPKD